MTANATAARDLVAFFTGVLDKPDDDTEQLLCTILDDLYNADDTDVLAAVSLIVSRLLRELSRATGTSAAEWWATIAMEVTAHLTREDDDDRA